MSSHHRPARALRPLFWFVLSALCSIAGFGLPATSAGAAEAPLLLLGPGQDGPLPEIRVVDRDPHGVTLEFKLNALQVEEVTAGGRRYQRISIPDGGEMGEIGAPSIPVFNRFLQAAEGAVVRVTSVVAEEEDLSGILLLPQQEEGAPGFAVDAAAYARDDFGIAASASAGASCRMRDLSLRSLTFAPVQYNPAQQTVRVARRLEVRVDFEGADLSQSWVKPGRPIASSFDRLYRHLVVNYDGPPPGVAVANGTWLCICPNNAGVVSRLQTLADWHQRQGTPVRIATTAETGTTTTSIRNYIQTAYNTWEIPPEFVCLGGDATGTYAIPCFFTSGGAADHPYTQLEGNDLVADVHIGRLSFSDLPMLDILIAKSVSYASSPRTTDPGWFTRATLVGDPSASGFSTVQVMQWIKTRLRQVGYTSIDTIFGGSFVPQMRTSLNRGESVFAYRGYIGMSGWSNTDTNNLTNSWELPFGVMSTCGTGNFDSGTSISESFLQAGTVDNPRGAIGAIGTATSSTHTRYNNCFTMGVWQGVLYEDQWEMGAAHTRGKTELFLNYGAADPGQATNFCSWNNLMGDPGCQVWTAFAASMTATYANPIPLGSSSFGVHVSEQLGNPCAGAQVCLWKGSEIYAVGITDAQGLCELAISAQTAGTAKLTITKHNRSPVLADVPVTAQPLFVSYVASVVDDDGIGESIGNGNGVVEPLETVELQVQVRNFGTLNAPGVSATFTTSDPYVTLLDDQEDFGSIAPGASAWTQDDFGFSVSPGCPHDHIIRFGMDISAGGDPWHSVIEIPVVSADLVSSGVTLYDAGNGRLDPGETLAMSVPLNNRGGADAQAVSATVTSLSPWVSFPDASGSYGTIGVGQTAENTVDRFTVGAASNTYQGHLAFFRLVTTFNNGVTDTSIVSLRVGQATSVDPIGPDAYGYYAFDNTDAAYPDAPVYNWIEISSSTGGGGGQVPLGDFDSYQDRSRSVALPFPFKFYGQTFSRATICSNGWIAMGETYLTDYRNWTLPGAGAPQNLIAAFWDDLRETETGGHVYQKYDADNHIWIVEWSNMVNEINLAAETFEMILYDPQYYPTPSGDGIIQFQYNAVHNVDGTDGYATVGIQNWDHTVGLLYSYYNLYPAGAAPLATGRAIRFVPRVLDVTGTENAEAAPLQVSLTPSQPNPFRGATSLSFSLTRPGQVRLAIYDSQGRRVRMLLSGTAPAGAHVLRWDGTDDHGRSLPTGMYFTRLEAEGRTLTRKLMRIE